MRITLETYGGMAAGLRRPPRSLETDALDEQSALEVARLIEDALAEESPAVRSASVPDAMSYTISVQDEATSHVLRQSDSSMSPRFADLLDWLALRFSPPNL